MEEKLTLDPARLLAACGSLELLSKRERAVRKKRKGVARRAYELKRLLIQQEKRARWFKEISLGTRAPQFDTVHRRLEEFMLATLHVAAKVELADTDVAHFFLRDRSAHFSDQERARELHPFPLRHKKFKGHAHTLTVLAAHALVTLDHGYDGERLSVTSLHGPVKWTLSHLAGMSWDASYTPEQFDKRAKRLMARHSLNRLKKSA